MPPDFPLDSLHRRLVSMALTFLKDGWTETNSLEAIQNEAEILGLQEGIAGDYAAIGLKAWNEAKTAGRDGEPPSLLPGVSDLDFVMHRQPGDEEPDDAEPPDNLNGVIPPETPEDEPAERGPMANSTNAEMPEVWNFSYEEQETEGGKTSYVRHPLDRATILESILKTCHPWPRLLGSELVYETPSGSCRHLSSPNHLFDFLKARTTVHWAKGPDFYSREEAFCGLLESAPEIPLWLSLPLHPLPHKAYLSKSWQNWKPTDGSHLRQLLSLFHPATPADEALLLALFLTPFWGGPPGQRPLFVITGPGGIGLQRTGKTTLAETVGTLAGGLITLDPNARRDSLQDQLLADPHLPRRVALLDNTEEILNLETLASLTTLQSIDSRPAWGHQRSRPNYLTFLVTSVSPALSQDLASRATVIQLSPPPEESLASFQLACHKLLLNPNPIILDCLSTLASHHPTISPQTRFPQWVQNVLACHPLALQALQAQKERAREVDSSSEELEIFLNALPAMAPKEFHPKELMEIWNSSTGSKLSAIGVVRKLRQADSRGKLPHWLRRKHEKKHGSPWLLLIPNSLPE